AIEDVLKEHGIETLTPVQLGVLDPEAGGRDLLVRSQTGSGKTIAFAFALLPDLGEGERDPRRPPTAIVLTPTRELAAQVRRELAWVLAPVGARVFAVTG